MFSLKTRDPNQAWAFQRMLPLDELMALHLGTRTRYHRDYQIPVTSTEIVKPGVEVVVSGSHGGWGWEEMGRMGMILGGTKLRGYRVTDGQWLTRRVEILFLWSLWWPKKCIAVCVSNWNLEETLELQDYDYKMVGSWVFLQRLPALSSKFSW